MDSSNTMNPQPSSSGGSKKRRNKKSRGKKPQNKKPQNNEPQNNEPQNNEPQNNEPQNNEPPVEKPQAVKKARGVDKATQTIDPPQLTEFTLFPKLPLEIRRKIWRSTFESRRVSLQGGSVNKTPPDQPLPPNYPLEQPAKDFFEYGAPYPQPIKQVPVAFVNRESRAETLLHYVRLYQDLHVPAQDGMNLKSPATIYFNPKLDNPWIFANKTEHAYNKMHLSCQRLLPSYDADAVEILKSIRTVDIWFMGFKESDAWSFDMDSCRDTLLMFENLETIRVTDAIIHFDLALLSRPRLDVDFNRDPASSFDVRSFVNRYFRRRGNHPGANGNRVAFHFVGGTLVP